MLEGPHMLGPAPLGPVDLLEKDWSAFAVLPQDADGSRTPRRVPRRSLAGVALPPGVGVDQPLTIEFTDSETGAESGEERDACERGVGPSGGGAWRVARRVGGAGLLGPQLEPLVSIQGRIAASSTREVAPRLEDEEGSGAAAGGADRAAGSQATPSTGHYSCRGVDDTSSDARSQAALEGSEPAMEDGGGSLQGSASVCQVGGLAVGLAPIVSVSCKRLLSQSPNMCDEMLRCDATFSDCRPTRMRRRMR